MITWAVLIVLLAATAQKDGEKLVAPERPVFGFPVEQSNQPSIGPKAVSGQSINPAKKSCGSSRNDAQLADVCFVDAQFGWAVGDHGAIWHTEDGGKQWLGQESGVDCILQSVCFISRNMGWAAGGYAEPNFHASRGVLLFTRDGGQTWTNNPRLLLPELKKICFMDPEHGWAVGFPSAMYPSGVFSSEDGGKSWQPVVGPGNYRWLTGDFLNTSIGALAGCYTETASIKHGSIEPGQSHEQALSNFRQMRLVPPLYGWLVGDGGLILQTGNAGSSWKPIVGNFPAGTAKQFDFYALAARGPKAWIAGAPGTRILYTPDAGATWSLYATGISTPIKSIAFVDDDHGWAVGSLGTILATNDGGKTWQRQHGASMHVALLGIVADVQDVPFELLAQASGNDGYLSAVEVLCRRDVEVRPEDDVPMAERMEQAVASVGGSEAVIAWKFPLRQRGLQITARHFIDGWNQTNDGRGLEELEEHVVKQLRQWRPDVVITNDIDARENEALAQIVGQMVVKAIGKAADPTCYAEQIAEAGLEPWQVKKVFAATDSGSKGSTEISTMQFAPRLGCSLADATAEARGLIEEKFSNAPPSVRFKQLAGQTSDSPQQQNGIGSLIAAANPDAKREIANAPPANIELLQHIAVKRRNSMAIIEQSQRDGVSQTKLLAQTDELIRGLDDNSAGRMLYYLADRYHHSSRWSMAADTYKLLVERYPQHALAKPALIWLVQYYSSGEAAWLEQSRQRSAVQQTSALSTDIAGLADRSARAVALGEQIAHIWPELFAEPSLRFPLAAAQRNQGSTSAAQKFYMSHSHGLNHSAWTTCAEGEAWLADRKSNRPKPTMQCRPARIKPKLDGRLDDAVWQKYEPTPLQSALKDDENWPAVVGFAYDKEYLYIAISCHRAPGVKYNSDGAARSRDTDLSQCDRVDVMIDIDRDFATYYRFTIDSRGWTSDSCWGDASWNPTWYVATDLTDDGWSAEAAIPLDQITGKNPRSEDVWAIGVQRTVPGLGFQSWSTPAATDIIPEGFGYLIFE